MNASSLDIAALSYGVGAAMFALLALLLVTAWRGRLQGGLLLMAVTITGLWCGAVAAFAVTGKPPFSALQLLEVMRNAAWFAFLFRLLGYAASDSPATRNTLRAGAVGAAALCLGVALFTLFHRFAPSFSNPETFAAKLPGLGHVLLAVCGLVLVEQIYRNTRRERRWAVKFMCFGVGGFFCYDLFLYAKALLFAQIDLELWTARGAIQAMVVPLIAVSARRNPDWSLDIFVSRHVVFHSTALLGASAYLILMAAAGYYIRIYGGSWGGVAQVVFLFGAVMVLAVLVLSGQFRSRLRVFLSKHFFRNRYDYREEWLRFTHTLSSVDGEAALKPSIIRAVADIVESPGGSIWVRQGTAAFRCDGTWGMAVAPEATLAQDDPMARFLDRTGWVIFLDEFRDEPEAYEDLELPPWLAENRDAWLVVPLMQGDMLLAFLVLRRAETAVRLNWEDSDLLKTVGRQAASYLALYLTTEALHEARQFDAFNRLSAYVVHDLKNVAAQLSLVVSNARRHMHTPGFMEDAVATVDNATGRMNRMLAQLRKGRMESSSARSVDLSQVLDGVVRARAVQRPQPTLNGDGAGLSVSTEPDRIAAVLEHLVQNAQEATAPEGEVTVSLRGDGRHALIEVRDTGCGMDDRFIAERLFRPFDTTKGNAGMGIGVYEAREFVVGMGGDINVSSTPGKGTVFRIRLPLASAAGPPGENVERMEEAT